MLTWVVNIINLNIFIAKKNGTWTKSTLQLMSKNFPVPKLLNSKCSKEFINVIPVARKHLRFTIAEFNE